MISDFCTLGGYFTRINTERRVFIYALCDPETGSIRYVGKSKNPKARRFAHIHDKEKSHKATWILSLKMRGLKPSLEIIEEVDESKWPEAEIFWIAYLRFIGCRLTNSVIGGDGPLRGIKKGPMNAQTKAKISAANKGRKISDEERNRLREMGRNRTLPKDHGERISRGLKGKPRAPKTTEHIAKIAAALRGRKPPTLALIRSAEATKGKKRPTHVIAAISRAHRGRKHSQEQIEKFKASMALRKGLPKRQVTQGFRLKMSLLKMGTKLSPETIAKRTESRKRMKMQKEMAKAHQPAQQP